MAECAALQEWAETTAPTIRYATPEQILVHLNRLNAVLPSRNADVETGKTRMVVYGSVLAAFTNEALTAMVREAVVGLDWFPTPKQCRELLAKYRAPATEQEMALLACGRFAQASFDEWFDNLTLGTTVGDVPDQWKRIAVEKGVMRLLEDGSFVVRALYQGPTAPRFAERPRASVKLHIPNRDDYVRIFGIDPEIEAIKAQAERDDDEETGRDMLLASVRQHSEQWSAVPVKVKYLFGGLDAAG